MIAPETSRATSKFVAVKPLFDGRQVIVHAQRFIQGALLPWRRTGGTGTQFCQRKISSAIPAVEVRCVHTSPLFVQLTQHTNIYTPSILAKQVATPSNYPGCR